MACVMSFHNSLHLKLDNFTNASIQVQSSQEKLPEKLTALHIKLVYVTGFAKKDLVWVSNFAHNFICE